MTAHPRPLVGIALALLALGPCLVAQSAPPAEKPANASTDPERTAALKKLETLERELEERRKKLDHVAALAELTQLDGKLDDAAGQRSLACRATLGVEKSLLEKAGALSSLDASKPGALVTKLAALDNNPEEELALASFCELHDLKAAALDALGRARDRDPKLKGDTDARVAELRGERIPRGGYHRYRGAWFGLDDRDRLRAFDEAYASLDRVASGSAVELPVALSASEVNLPRVDTATKKASAEFLRTSAATLRTELRADYDTVRNWLPSYAKQTRMRQQILEKRAALDEPRKAALDLIRKYDKSQQPEVDNRVRAVEKAYDDYRKLVDRDHAALDRVQTGVAWEVLVRIREREAALKAIDAYLGRFAKPGLGAAQLRPADTADVGEQRHLPGREQSELCDVLWLLLHWRADQLRDAIGRADELERHRKKLSPWEAWLLEELRADAIELYNERSAHSLDKVEVGFVTRLNEYRRALGLRPFEVEERCNVSARKHSQEMVELGYFGHISPVPRNRTPSDRVRLEGYNGGVGENCLGGRVDGPGAFRGWYYSPGHHRNLISGGPHLGVGTANDHGMWTMVAGGNDLAWRRLHEDVAPADTRKHVELVEALFASGKLPVRSKRTKGAQQQAAEQLATGLPMVLPPLARRAFPAIRDPRHPDHPASALALRQIIEAEVPIEWRPLQIAAVAALIEALGSTANAQVRTEALATITPHVEETFGYDPSGTTNRRVAAAKKLLTHWEDDAQWRYRGQPDAVAPVPSSLPGRVGDGPSRKSKLKVLSKSQRLRLARKNGGSSTTEQAIDAGLKWLARAQSDDGAWRAKSFVANDEAFKPKGSGAGNQDWDAAMTGLSLLAFSAAGHTIDQGDHRETVARGADYLLRNIVDYGKFDTSTSHYMYSHAIAAQALCELYAYTDNPRLATGAQLATDYLMFAQHEPSGGWRYEANQAGDTSVVGWVLMAMNSAYKAGIDVGGFRNAERFLDHVTAPGYYQVGYQHPPDLNKAENLRLTAVGMVARLFLGEPRTSAKIVLPAWRQIAKLPNAKDPDFYRYYYATLALFQVGGDQWKAWNEALVPALLERQVDRESSPYYGSWQHDGHHGKQGGRIYATALGILMLTTYYRYDRSSKLKVHPFTGNLKKDAQPYLEALRKSPSAQAQSIALAKLLDQMGPSIAPVLIGVVKDENEKLPFRRRIAQSLGSICRTQHEAALLELVANKDHQIARHAANALADICSEASMPSLLVHLDHPNRDVRAYCASALGRLGDGEIAGRLQKRLDVERDGHVKRHLQASIRRLAHRSEIDRLVSAALGKRKKGRLAVIDSLDVLQQTGVATRLVLLESSQPKLYKRALAAIVKNRGGASVPLLIELLRSELLEDRDEAIKLLRAISGVKREFDPKGAADARLQAIRAWEEWWAERGKGFGG